MLKCGGGAHPGFVAVHPGFGVHPGYEAVHPGSGAVCPGFEEIALAVGLYFLGYTSFRKKGLHYVTLN